MSETLIHDVDDTRQGGAGVGMGNLRQAWPLRAVGMAPERPGLTHFAPWEPPGFAATGGGAAIMSFLSWLVRVAVRFVLLV